MGHFIGLYLKLVGVFVVGGPYMAVSMLIICGLVGDLYGGTCQVLSIVGNIHYVI